MVGYGICINRDDKYFDHIKVKVKYGLDECPEKCQGLDSDNEIQHFVFFVDNTQHSDDCYCLYLHGDLAWYTGTTKYEGGLATTGEIISGDGNTGWTCFQQGLIPSPTAYPTVVGKF